MVYVLLGAGFEEMEAVVPVDLMRRAGIDARFVGIGGDLITGGNGITVKADMIIEDMALEEMDMIVLPGGNGGVKSIRRNASAAKAITYAYDNHKYIASICAAPTLLGQMGLLNGVNAVCYPGMEGAMAGAHFAGNVKTVRDGRFIFGQAPGAAVDFGLRLVEALKGEDAVQRVKDGIVFTG